MDSELLLGIAVGATMGVVVGFAVAVYRKIIKKDEKFIKANEKQIEIIKRNAKLVTSITFLVLAIGLIWTVYCMVLGLIDSTQTEYATNISQLIVSVLTVFSIMIAFYQFLREK